MRSITKKEKNQSLHDHMIDHYVDGDGKTIVEATQLGISILEMYGAIHESLGVLIEKADLSKFNIFCDFFLSLVSENFSSEALSENREFINCQVETLKSLDLEAGLSVDKFLYGAYKNVIENEFFQSAGCNIVLRSYIIEGVTRTVNCYAFIFSKEQNLDIATANFQCSYHALAAIALLCEGDMSNYYSMNLHVESYADHISKSLREVK